MNRSYLTSLTIGLLLFFFVTSYAMALPASFTGEHDIGELLERAGKSFDLSAADSVLLLDEQREYWTEDGRAVHTVHRIVLVRTAFGIRRHADLRVPYDAARQDFTVAALRTWRPSDAIWIDSGTTARVETLPYAVGNAPDYSDRREMMLLHDGVELPCIMETIYTVEDREPYRSGSTGLWTFPREDPAIISRLVLGFPAGKSPLFIAPNGSPQPVRGNDTEGGLETLTFQAGPEEALPHPRTADAASEVSHLIWSTWRDWSTLGEDLLQRFEAGIETGDDLNEALEEHLKTARTTGETARLVAEFISNSTSPIHASMGWWPGPRAAQRTWSTAYGDRIDRTVLAAALYRRAGFSTDLTFVGRPSSQTTSPVPTLHWSDGPGLWVNLAGYEGYFDPDSATFHAGPARLSGRAIWRPAREKAPVVRWGKAGKTSRIEIRLDLSLDAEEEKWIGSGTFTATDALSPFDQMVGLEDETLAFLDRTVKDVLGGGEVTGHNAAVFTPLEVTVGFSLELPLGEPDDLGSYRMVVADPGKITAFFDREGVRLHQQHRGTGISLPTAMDRWVEVKLDPGELEVVHLPESRNIASNAGRFVIVTRDEDGELNLIRHLVLTKNRYTSDEWPDLRPLLLADDHAAGQLLLFEH